MKELDRKVLSVLSAYKGELSASILAEKAGVAVSSVMSVLAGLESDGFAVLRKEERKRAELTDEGNAALKNGLPERRLVRVLGKKALALGEAFKKANLSPAEQGIALMWAKKSGALTIEGGKASVASDKPSESETALEALAAGKSADVSLLIQRKLARDASEKTVLASITASGKSALKDPEADAGMVSALTPEMLKSGSWKGQKFRPYDLKTVVAPVLAGRKHPYQEFLQKMRDKLVGLGFREVDGSLVETEFWNMDSLFMAQDHPARDLHDVFYVEQPSLGLLPDDVFVQKVKKAHEEGLEGSKGWRYSWDPRTSARLIARSHDTGISSRELHRSKEFPDRVFFIARVFRPDEIDWKHFIEFSQLGGYVAGNIQFSDLLGQLKTFAQEVFQAEDVKFVPSYFPFTEPSVELYAKIPGRGWAEVGGAGMFRPEMLSALGVSVPVVAWGLGIDRLAMVSMGITDIRDLFSHDLGYLRGSEAKKSG
ncbi:phenylalanine--tRNA ligase subunit alpha [Candidatus Micrarchaeota archaeon]|nr:phenylalanine--tRNA ligase subunit alpha [Candidatus Micrarchaeota archaeon]